MLTAQKCRAAAFGKTGSQFTEFDTWRETEATRLASAVDLAPASSLMQALYACCAYARLCKAKARKKVLKATTRGR